MSKVPIKSLAVAVIMAFAAPITVISNPPPQAAEWPAHKSGIRGQLSVPVGLPHSGGFVPVQASLAIFSEDGTHITTVDSEQDGTFAVGLKRGTYIVFFPPIPAAPYAQFPVTGFLAGETRTVIVEHKECTEESMVYFPGLISN